MATATSAPQVPGRNNWIGILCLLGCTFSCSVDQPQSLHYNAATVAIHSKKGITYVNTTPVSGVVFELNEKGDTLSVVPYLDGKENGMCRHYYGGGKPKAFRYYVRGRKEGEHHGWFENGARQFVYHFKNDMFEGNQKEWLINGQQYSDLNYIKGMESGSQKVWYENGKIKTNYTIINNRRYGLLGTKNCVNAVDSIFKR
jgi:antitoxin component YwqK of YwqJK toxin-antitoxin module